jgi:hypothetical protein
MNSCVSTRMVRRGQASNAFMVVFVMHRSSTLDHKLLSAITCSCSCGVSLLESSTHGARSKTHLSHPQHSHPQHTPKVSISPSGKLVLCARVPARPILLSVLHAILISLCSSAPPMVKAVSNSEPFSSLYGARVLWSAFAETEGIPAISPYRERRRVKVRVPIVFRSFGRFSWSLHGEVRHTAAPLRAS